jgi:hypothetical protein
MARFPLAALAAAALLAVLALPAAAPAASRPCHVGASFSPTRGNPERLVVRFSARGFGRGRPIYLHYLAPGRHLVRTIGLGFGQARCGSIVTSRRRLFPFRTVRSGTWRLQFDTQGRYHSRPRAPFVVLAVPVIRQ